MDPHIVAVSRMPHERPQTARVFWSDEEAAREMVSMEMRELWTKLLFCLELSFNSSFLQVNNFFLMCLWPLLFPHCG